MGFSLSWIAFSGKAKGEVLSALALIDSGKPDAYCESPIAGAELPGGWYVVCMHPCNHPLTADQMLAKFSTGCTLLGCQVEEHVMVSTGFEWRDGKASWAVAHDSANGRYDLSVDGTPPARFHALRDAAIAAQDDEGGDQADVDLIFDVPLDLVRAICGFRHDRLDEPDPAGGFRPRYRFTKLVAANA